MKPNIPKLIFAALAIIYFLSIAIYPLEGSFLDIVDLPIHETGHLLFRPFGEFMMFAGGTIFQIVMPAVFVGYFVWKEKYYSAAIVLFWVGQSFLNIHIYASDAVQMVLPLVGGGEHDWNYLLTQTGLLGSTKTVADIFRVIGTLVILAASVLSVYYSFSSTDE
jgi:hypothetical protein